METAPLKAFATSARTELIREVTARITAVLSLGSPERVESPTTVAGLEKAIAASGGGDKGKAHVAEKVAYTWFNRIIALRFMDANGYTGVGVISPAADQISQPEVLAAAKRGQIDTEVVPNNHTMAAITGLLNGTRQPRLGADAQAEAYSLLLAAYCQFWNKAMPFMFERHGDFTELLIPANLLASDSMLNRAVEVLSQDVCKDVEVIGWLYQFYISERKEQVFAGFRKNKKAGADEIPAATQLFTPHWIVRYLVENSLGRLWMLNRPNSRLIHQMDYYIAPVDEETDFLKIAKPEELKVIDPACGSGHMLTYAFDLLYAIYEEEGHAPSEIPKLILTNNLYGTEIDQRAGGLAAFALTMKARARQRTFFAEKITPNICVIEPISFSGHELDLLLASGGERQAVEVFWNQFANADVLGALVSPDGAQVSEMGAVVDRLRDSQLDLFGKEVVDRALRVLRQAEFLTRTHSVVVANPPYMGSGNMSGPLSDWVRITYPDARQDLYACFVDRAYEMTGRNGLIAMIIGDTWMTIKTFDAFRIKLLARGGMLTFLHLDDISNHPDVFGANAAFVLERDGGRDLRCSFIQLEPLSGESKRVRLQEAIADPSSPWVYPVRSSVFARVPGAPFTYRMSETMRSVFMNHPDLASVAQARQGLATANDGRFLRYWYEVGLNRTGLACPDRVSAESSGRRWFPFNKGGPFRRWYGNIQHVVNWCRDGQEIRTTLGDNGRVRARPQNMDLYFRPAVTWSNVSSGAPAFRAVDEGVIFGHVGQSVFGTEDVLVALLAILNSQYGHHVLGLLSPTLHFEVGTISRVPINLELDPQHRNIVKELVRISKQDWDTQETSLGFEKPDWEYAPEGPLAAIMKDRFDFWASTTERVRSLEAQNDHLILGAYGLDNELTAGTARTRVSLVNNPYFRFDDVDSDASAYQRFVTSSVEDLVSYSIGCMFGRYSLDAAGLILADQSSTLHDYFTKVPNPTFAPDDDNVVPVVDGDWFEDDIVTRFRHFLRVAFGKDHFEENLRFVTESLGVKNLREYFVTKAGKSKFYDDHVQRYKKRPIYWLFSSPKGSFNALIYLHRYTPSTASTVLTYLREYVTKLASSLQQAERAGNAREADRLRKILVELNEYEHDTLYPKASENVVVDLDDGVKTNYPKLGGALRKISGLEASGD